MKKGIVLLVLSLTLTFFGSTALADLVAYWSFNNPADLGHDDAGKGHNGTVYGTTPTTDRFGNPNLARSFDGVNDYIEVPDSDALDPVTTQEITIAAWVKISTYEAQNSSNYFAIVDKTGGPSREIGSYAFSIANSNDGTNETGKLSFQVCYDGLHFQEVLSNSQVPLDRWVHVAASHDAGGTTKLYIDDEVTIDTATITQDFRNTAHPLTIGYSNSYADYFYGSIDEVQLYNVAIPEPATMLLLGLGGVLMRKRK